MNTQDASNELLKKAACALNWLDILRRDRALGKLLTNPNQLLHAFTSENLREALRDAGIDGEAFCVDLETPPSYDLGDEMDLKRYFEMDKFENVVLTVFEPVESES